MCQGIIITPTTKTSYYQGHLIIKYPLNTYINRPFFFRHENRYNLIHVFPCFSFVYFQPCLSHDDDIFINKLIQVHQEFLF